jgi:cobalt-zinc-cadmium efflux system membrane fusion protein
LAEVHCHFDKYDHSLVPGNVYECRNRNQYLFFQCIPEESIVNFEGKDFVLWKEKQTYRLTPVTLGETENGFIQILNFADFKNKKIVTKMLIRF